TAVLVRGTRPIFSSLAHRFASNCRSSERHTPSAGLLLEAARCRSISRCTVQSWLWRGGRPTHRWANHGRRGESPRACLSQTWLCLLLPVSPRAGVVGGSGLLHARSSSTRGGSQRERGTPALALCAGYWRATRRLTGRIALFENRSRHRSEANCHCGPFFRRSNHLAFR